MNDRWRAATAAAADMVDQQPHRFARHIGDGLADGGQFRPHGGGEWRVIEADNGQVARHIQPTAMGNGHGGQRHDTILCRMR